MEHIERPRLILCAGDHQEDAAQQAANAARIEALISGDDPLNALAQQVTADLIIVDAGVRTRYATPPAAMRHLVAAPVPRGDLGSARELGRRVAVRSIQQAAVDLIALGFLGGRIHEAHTAVHAMVGVILGAADHTVPVIVGGHSGVLALQLAHTIDANAGEHVQQAEATGEDGSSVLHALTEWLPSGDHPTE